MTNKKGIYLHIPFCVKKCNYCDFLSAAAEPYERSAYVKCLEKEILAYQGYGYTADTVFFGGGTPSLLSVEDFDRLLNALTKSFLIDEDAEITVECNPETADKEKLAFLRQSGVNRISFGLQSTSDRELALLGRIHTYQRFLEAYQAARDTGFANINIDLMSAIPSQTESSWEDGLRKACDLRPSHISAYSLMIEEGTPFYNRRKELALPDEDTERRMYHLTGELLSKAGYRRYEISNYALSGFECRHNKKYWTGGDYIGLGLGASSCLNGARFHNPSDIGEYRETCESPDKLKREEEPLTRERRMEEFCFLGLRLIEGISKEEFLLRFGVSIEAVYGEALKKLGNFGLLEQKGDRIALTERGIDVSNQVFLEFLL